MKRFLCTDSLLMLPTSGAFLALLGVLLIILYIVARGLTASLYYVEGALPTYVVAVLLILTGTAMIVLMKKRPNLLIYVAMALNCAVFSLSALQAVSVGVVSIPFLASFSACVYHSSLSECQCYILTAKENNSTGIIVPGADSEKVTFQAVRSCSVIERNMIDCLYILCIIYGFAGIASLVTGSLSFMLLCSQRRATKEARALQQADLSRNRRQLSDNSAPQTNDTNRESRNQPSTEASNPTAASSANAGSGPAGPGRRATIGHHDVRTERPRIVQRSSSTSTAHGRPARRNSGDATRGTAVRGSSASQQQQQHANLSQRQGSRAPTLVRGGYLQIHVNGPSIPVYVVPGSSNVAFVALTDLPSLQLPSLDSVPAYVSEVADLYPSDQPPPYSPTPDEHHPPTFSAIMESPSTPTAGNGRDPSQRLVLLQEEPTDLPRGDQAHTENDVSAESAEQRVTPVITLDQPSPNQTGAVEMVTESPDQSQTTCPSPGVATPQSSPGDSDRATESTPVSGAEVAESHQETTQSSTASPRTEATTEPPANTSSNSETSHHAGNDKNNQSGDSPTLPASSQSQGARPKQRQSRPRAGEEAYLAHTRSSSTPRSSSSPRTPSPQRGSSPHRRPASPRRRQQALSEAPPRQSVSPPREATRARSNSRGRQRQLPDILPRTDHLTRSREPENGNSSDLPQPASSSSRVQASQNKHRRQQSSSQKRQERSPRQASHGETSSRRPPKNPDRTQPQTGSMSKSRERPSQHNPDLGKESARRERRPRSSSAKRASGGAKIEMNIPPKPASSSSVESLTNILTLVESVHSSVKAKPTKHRKASNEERVNLVDSRV